MKRLDSTRFVASMLVIVGIAALAMDSRDATGRCRTLLAPTGAALTVLVADNAAARSVGLSSVDASPRDGLLLEWPTAGRHPIWMADMLFDLDLLWLAEDGRVLAALENVPACSLSPCPLYEPEGSTSARAVLELPAGRTVEIGLTPGARLAYADTPLTDCGSPQTGS